VLRVREKSLRLVSSSGRVSIYTISTAVPWDWRHPSSGRKDHVGSSGRICSRASRLCWYGARLGSM